MAFEKRMKEIQDRKVEIRKQLLAGGDVDLQTLKTELATLDTEKDALEERAKIAGGINDGSIAGTPVFEKRGSDKPEVENMGREDLLKSEEYRSAWLKQLKAESCGNDPNFSEVEKRSITSASSSGGAVMPTITLNKVIKKLEQISIIYPLVSGLEIPSSVTIPFEKDTAEAGWVDMDTASTDSDDTVDKLSLSAYKILKTIEIDADVDAMSIDAFEEFIVTRLGEKVKKVVDISIISGSGNKTATGIITALNGTAYSITTEASTGWTYDDIQDLFAALPSSYAVNGKLIMNRKFLYGTIAKIKDEDGDPIFVKAKTDTLTIDKSIEGKLQGYPVVVYDNVPDDTIIFGDLSYYFFNWVKAFTITKSLEAGFRKGSVVYRALGLADGNVALKEAFRVMKKKAA